MMSVVRVGVRSSRLGTTDISYLSGDGEKRCWHKRVSADGTDQILTLDILIDVVLSCAGA